MQYQRKPELIEALQWTGENVEEMIEFLGGNAAAEGFSAGNDNFQMYNNKLFLIIEGYTDPVSIGNYVKKDEGYRQLTKIFFEDKYQEYQKVK